ncbi:MAG: AAA family ATPase [Polyangiales bacterium]
MDLTLPIRRRIEMPLQGDLARKMVLLAGPRQCGKTTVAKMLVAQQAGAYFNWDVA